VRGGAYPGATPGSRRLWRSGERERLFGGDLQSDPLNRTPPCHGGRSMTPTARPARTRGPAADPASATKTAFIVARRPSYGDDEQVDSEPPSRHFRAQFRMLRARRQRQGGSVSARVALGGAVRPPRPAPTGVHARCRVRWIEKHDADGRSRRGGRSACRSSPGYTHEAR
jgi:hypothetical protein